VICCVIANYHPMLGVDFQDGFPALIPIPLIPKAPHVVFAMVRFGPWWMAGAVENADIQMPPGNAMAKIFDIGMFIPHLTFPALNHFVYMLIYTLCSTSQGHFGVSSVLTPKGPIAVALMLFVNPQLHCDAPLPLPTGVVLAPNTVVAGLTIGDFLAGIFSMVLTSAVTWACGKVVSWGTNIASKALGGLGDLVLRGLVRFVPPNIMLPTLLVGAFLNQRFPGIAAMVLSTETPSILAAVVNWAVGSPMGWAFPGSAYERVNNGINSVFGLPDGSNFIQVGSESAGNAIGDALGLDEYFNDTVLLPPFPLGPLPTPVLLPVPGT